jgi:hypothetical protein
LSQEPFRLEKTVKPNKLQERKTSEVSRTSCMGEKRQQI